MDLAEHLDRIIDASDTYRDLVDTAMETYYLVVSSRTNKIAKVLTIISTIMMPLTFITGLYGMNVHIPRSENTDYFWLILVGCIALVTGMLVTYRRRTWI